MRWLSEEVRHPNNMLVKSAIPLMGEAHAEMHLTLIGIHAVLGISSSPRKQK